MPAVRSKRKRAADTGGWNFNDIHKMRGMSVPMFLAKYVHRNELGEPIRIRENDYAWEILNDTWCRNPVIMSCTQSSKTLIMIIGAMAVQLCGLNHIYFNPTDPHSNDFFRSRIRPLLKKDRDTGAPPLVPHYARLMSSSGSMVKCITRTGGATYGLYSGSFEHPGGRENPVSTSKPADFIWIDEFMLCNPLVIRRAKGRFGRSKYKNTFISFNPRVDGDYSHAEYARGDQRHWTHPCSDCGKQLRPDWFEHVVYPDTFQPRARNWREDGIRAICDHCGRAFDRYAAGAWAADASENPYPSYTISNLFAGTWTLEQLYNEYQDALNDPERMQIFYNNFLGLPFRAAGAGVSQQDLVANIYDLENFSSFRGDGALYAGIDCNKHYMPLFIARRIGSEWEPRLQIVHMSHHQRLSGLLAALRGFPGLVKIGIDGLPETELVDQLRESFPGKVYAHYFRRDSSGAPRVGYDVVSGDPMTQSVTTNRTTEMGRVARATREAPGGREGRGYFLFPRGAERIGEDLPRNYGTFFQQICAPVRYYDEKAKAYRWSEHIGNGVRRDDAFHALLIMAVMSQL